MALSKDGVPYELISKAIHSIEREINNVIEKMNEELADLHIKPFLNEYFKNTTINGFIIDMGTFTNNNINC